MRSGSAYRSDKSGRSEVYVQPFPLGQGIERMIDLVRRRSAASLEC